ncbi:uncharacterized protein [Dermacentor albipictus]|uniref:uncharacterized protein n=1 Tax=Dermacentor albipictus TaxID=60249 RepID=UPI0038FCFF5A
MSGRHSLWELNGRHRSCKCLFIFGVALSIVLLVVVSQESEDARSAYCLVSVTVLVLTEALPTQVTVMMPLFLYMELELFGEVTDYFPGSVLHLVAVMLMIASTDSTTLATHVTFFVLSVTGTRLRNLQLTCLALSCFLSLLMEETLAVLLMARLILKAVEVLQQESVQVLHQRELFRKTVTRNPALSARPDIREALLGNIDDTGLESPASTSRELPTSRAPLSVLQTGETPSTSSGQRASSSDIQRPASLPVLNETADQSAVIGPVDRETQSLESSLSADSSFLTSEDLSFLFATEHSDRRGTRNFSAEDHVPASPSVSPSLSSKPSPIVDSDIAAGKPASSADVGYKTCETENSVSNQTTAEASVCSVSDKACNDDSSLCQKSSEGLKDSQGTGSQETEGSKADRNRKITWKRILGRVGHSAAGAFPPLRSLMERSMLSGSDAPVPVLVESGVTDGSGLSASASVRGVALKSALLSPNRSRTRKTTTLLEDGKIFFPGESSPPKKSDQEKKRKLFVPEEDRHEVREIYFWKKERYHTIHKKLLLSVVIMCALASIMNLTSNGGNLEFLLYFKRNFGQDSIISAKNWWMLFLPMELLAFLLHWQFMWFTFLHHFDAPQSSATSVAIKLHIQKWRNDLGVVRVAEFVPAVLIIIWLGIYITSVSGMILNTPAYEQLELDFIVIVALFSLPWTWCRKPPTAGLRLIVQRLPWGAVITYGGTFTLSFIVKSSKFAAWLRDHLISLQAYSRSLSQASLTVCAAFMTELLSSRHTVRILLPVATEAALVRPCNPLYYALPVTVAASSSMVFPTARVTIALLSELTDIGPLSMLLYGILLKALIVTFALISVDTLGHQVFNWSVLPAWMLSHHLNTSGDWLASPRWPSTPLYVQQLGPPVL